MASNVAVKFYGTDEYDVPLDPVPRPVHAPAATNKFLNNEAPVTQTITAPTGSHTCWMEGTGSVTLSGGLTGVVTDGSPVSGDPGGVDVLCTVAGSPDFVVFENNAAQTFPIWTAGSPLTRDADAISYDSANHSDTEGTWLIEVEATGAANILDGFLSHTGTEIQLNDGTNTQASTEDTSSHKVGIVYGDSTMRLNVDGVWQTEGPYDGTLLSGILDLARASAVVEYFGEIRRYDVKSEAIVDEWMAA